jgi:hypothetical protein
VRLLGPDRTVDGREDVCCVRGKVASHRPLRYITVRGPFTIKGCGKLGADLLPRLFELHFRMRYMLQNGVHAAGT